MAYIRCGGGGIPAALKTDMNAVFNKKFETSTTYPPNTWADTVNLMGALPIRSASGSIASFNDGADLVPLKSLTLAVTPSQSGTGDPSPTNPRPLNSFSSLKVEHTGKNLFTSENEQTPAYINSSGTIQGGAGANGWALSDYIEVKAGETYYFNPNTTGGSTAKHAYFDSSKTFVSAINSGEGSFTVPSGIKYMRFSYRTSSTDIQLEFGSSATTYEPYRTPDPHTLDLGATVYGVTGDVVSGEFEETYKTEVITGADVTSVGETTGGIKYARIVVSELSTGRNADCFCDRYKPTPTAIDKGIYWISASQKVVRIYDNDFTDLETAQAILNANPVTYCYPLATPTALTIDPVEIESFKGGNNIWCDKENSTTAVEYRADIDLLISELGG